MKKFEELLRETIEETSLYIEEPMSKHTTFRVGGVADYYIQMNSIEGLQKVKELCAQFEIPYYVIGNGSNLLVGDKGYRGLIIEVGNQWNRISCHGGYIYAEAGASLSKVAKVALDHELTGLEFAAGIPGNLGGAIVMNAGAYGGEIKDVVESVRIINEENQVEELTREDLKFGYRTSAIMSSSVIVVGVKMKLEKGTKKEIKEKMDEWKLQRVTKQPLDMPSAGSTFKRPLGYFAAKLIDEAGLRGFQVGGAQVSVKHCGFVVNTGNATAAHIAQLMETVRQKVKEQFGVELEPEVKRIGEF